MKDNTQCFTYDVYAVVDSFRVVVPEGEVVDEGELVGRLTSKQELGLPFIGKSWRAELFSELVERVHGDYVPCKRP